VLLAHLSGSSAEWGQLRLLAQQWLLPPPPPVHAGCHEAARAAHLQGCTQSCQCCELIQASRGCGASKQHLPLQQVQYGMARQRHIPPAVQYRR
jgi:hypothetical protein